MRWRERGVTRFWRWVLMVCCGVVGDTLAGFGGWRGVLGWLGRCGVVRVGWSGSWLSLAEAWWMVWV